MHNGTKFYEKYMSSQNQHTYFDDNGSGLLPKIFAKKWKNLNDHRTYSHREYFLQNVIIKDRRITQAYSGKKRKGTGYVLLTGSKYRDAEVSSHHRSCLHDAIINAAPRVGEKLTNQNYIDNVHLEG